MKEHNLEKLNPVQAASKGDLNAFNELVLQYQDQIFHHAYHILGNQDLAEDVTQDTFIRAFQKINQFKGGTLRGWLLKIATNLCYDEMRTWKRHPHLSLEPASKENNIYESPFWLKDPMPLPEEEAEASDLRETLECTMSKLPFIYRTTLLLIDVHEFNYKEAASIMGIPIGTLKSRLARGRMQFRNILMDIDPQYISNSGIATRPKIAFLPCQSK